MDEKKIELGDKVKDVVSGFEGVAVGLHEYLHGCTRITVMPKVKKDGSFSDERTFDAPQLKIVKKQLVNPGAKIKGGPRSVPSSKTTGRS